MKETKEFTKPELGIIHFDGSDIIATSINMPQCTLPEVSFWG